MPVGDKSRKIRPILAHNLLFSEASSDFGDFDHTSLVSARRKWREAGRKGDDPQEAADVALIVECSRFLESTYPISPG